MRHKCQQSYFYFLFQFAAFSAHWFLAIICYPGLEEVRENPFIPKPHIAPPPLESAIPTPPQPRDDDEEDMDMEEMESEVFTKAGIINRIIN